jgi:hypothetical protein
MGINAVVTVGSVEVTDAPWMPVESLWGETHSLGSCCTRAGRPVAIQAASLGSGNLWRCCVGVGHQASIGAELRSVLDQCPDG